MGNELDEELARACGEGGADSPLVKARAADRLARLRSEIATSSKAQEGVLDCVSEDDSIAFFVRGQPIGRWRSEGATLTLYRAGSADAECHATSVADAVRLTARLVAAVAQA